MPRYDTNYLEKVILKLDFENISLAKLNEYTEIISPTFDINNTKTGFEGSFNIDVVQGVVEQSKQDLNIQEYSSTQKPNKKITLSQKWISIEYEKRSYTNSEELLSDIDEFVQPFIDILEVKLINRVGLRYINQIAAPDNNNPLDWAEYINNKLVASVAFAKSKQVPVSRVFTQQLYKMEGADLLFSFGIWNDDFPNPIATKNFVLDYDCSSGVPREASDISLRSEVRGYNDKIEEFFESSIKQPLRELMGVQA